MFPTDKISHGYLPTYLQIASDVGTHGTVCEIGVANGGSLVMWCVLFPHGTIVGVDNNPDAAWPPGTHQIIAEQDDPTLPDQIKEIAAGYDLIVDDASHIGKLTKETLRLLWPLVNPGGRYVIEDWQVSIWNGARDDGSMLETVQSLLCALHSQHSDVESITYKYGMAILRKR